MALHRQDQCQVIFLPPLPLQVLSSLVITPTWLLVGRGSCRALISHWLVIPQ
jgi:hypothetical protein